MTNNLKGLLINIFSIFLFSLMDALVKYALDHLPAHQIMLFRSVCGVPFLLMYAYKEGYINDLKPKHIPLQIARAVVGAFATYLFFKSYEVMPLANAVSIIYSAPLMLTILSVFFLNEKVGVFRWSLVIIGFIGVMLVTDPFSYNFGYNVIYPLLSALTWAIITILLKKILPYDNIYTTTLIFSFATFILACFMTYQHGWVEIKSWGLVIVLILIGILGIFAQYFMAKALIHAETSLLAISKYTTIIFSIISGFIFWGEIPSYLSFVGIFIIILTGILTIQREIHLKKKKSLYRKFTKTEKN